MTRVIVRLPPEVGAQLAEVARTEDRRVPQQARRLLIDAVRRAWEARRTSEIARPSHDTEAAP
jgi:hypothetical protein